jgi:hypothetical protein
MESVRLALASVAGRVQRGAGRVLGGRSADVLQGGPVTPEEWAEVFRAGEQAIDQRSVQPMAWTLAKALAAMARMAQDIADRDEVR